MAGSALWTINLLVVGCLLLPYLSWLTTAHYHDLQTHYQSWYRPRLLPIPSRRAVDLMSDIINDLGIRILQQYVESGNVAFSPAGIGFILAALYEGSASRSRQQIIDSLGMPRDKNAVRIGMRDIHKRLRTYLNPDGFLGGLNLNQENTSLRADYETILRFYGFDLTIDLSTFGANNTSNFGLKGSTTTTTSTTEMQTTTISEMTTPTNMPPTTSNDITGSANVMTMQPNAETTIATTVTATSTPSAPPTSAPTTSMPSLSIESSNVSQSNQQMTTTSSSSMTTMSLTTTSPTSTVAPANGAMMTTTIPPMNVTGRTTPVEDAATVAPPTTSQPKAARRRRDNRRRRSHETYFSTIPDDGLWIQALDIWADQVSLPDNIRATVDLQFLVNGCEPANVPAATYTAVLPFAYFPSLKAAALEFPLDNPRYNVMLLLPTEGVDTIRLARELSGHNLRLLRKQLQATWVHATIPSFMLRGFVTLTPYLQRLGIKDVFEPRLADLSPMTPDLGVYARDVQQSIAVNIRNYMKDDGAAKDVNATKTRTSRRANLRDLLQEEPPLILPLRSSDYRFQRPATSGLLDRVGLVSFIVDRPFLYFILDDETSASLIAGRIDDPLNSRIL